MRPRVVLPLLVLLLTATLAGCGRDAASRPVATVASPPQQARATAERYGVAIGGRDWARVCDDLLAARLRETIESYGVACPQAVGAALGAVREPTLRVTDVQVAGTRARVRVLTAARGETSSADVLGLERGADGSWRIADLGT